MGTTAVTAGSGPYKLLRVLGVAFGVAVGVGATIGSGLLRTPGSVLNEVPRPLFALGLWAFGGVHALLGANVVAEVMTAVPKSGGLFVVARRAFGEFGGLLVGWSDWLLSVAACAALAIASAEFIALLYPPVSHHIGAAGVGVASAFFLLNWVGVREGSVTQIVSSAAKGVLLMAVIAAVFVWPPKASGIQPNWHSVGPLTAVGVVVAYQLIAGVYSGWSLSAYFAEENTEPSKDIPRSMLLSIILVTGIYVLMNAALLRALPVAAIRQSELPVALALSPIAGEMSVRTVALLAVVTAMSCLNAGIMVTVRILHGLARDGLFPAFAAHVNKGGTPDLALVVTAVFTILLTLSGRFETALLIVGAMGVFTYAVTDAALFKLRFSEPQLARPFRAIGYPGLPALALLLDTFVVLAFLWSDLKSAFYMMAAVGIAIPIGWWLKWRAPSRRLG